MQKYWMHLKNILYMVLIPAAAFLLSQTLHTMYHAEELIPSLFVLAVFVVSLVTDGYYYGIAAALISVLAVNFAFTFPYFEFNFSIHENAVSAVIMLGVTIATSALTTKIKRQEAMRAETEREKMRANLLRAISHDLRTPLTAIYGASSTMIDNYDMLRKEDQIEMLCGIREDSQWLIRMVENLLSVTRIDASNVKLIRSSVVLEELVDSVLAKFKKRYPSQNVELILPDVFITISADAILIEQVLINLLENAVQHAQGMTKLQLSIRADESFVVFEVIDNGCGIGKEQLKTILSGRTPQESVTADGHKQGMGIGLSVCATIVKAHSGEIYAHNAEGGGMIFGFTLVREVGDDEQQI